MEISLLSIIYQLQLNNWYFQRIKVLLVHDISKLISSAAF